MGKALETIGEEGLYSATLKCSKCGVNLTVIQSLTILNAYYLLCTVALKPPDSHRLTLDLNTVNKHIRLSEGNRVITDTDTVQPYPDHPDRFDECPQVLCRESVCDRRCYWEIEWSGRVDISVSYKSIRRKGSGDECEFGYNDQSWSLFCSSYRCSFRHNDIQTELLKSISSRIGVYVDHSAGTLSFYSFSDIMKLIHTVQTTFTQPLYPGFRVGYKSSVKLC
ncbi:Stonustoxin subunit alpha [Anabarilius grahami]|uniref:Stonustoxin subunit alpha n=1 Tax=Anabarilius grahami TaxID=495550 RepID=A0A3N0YY89_ANAGA|nr:Stonustoxin subunit alpha [Anabarilius grahami]